MARTTMNPMEWLRKRLEEDDADLVREMLGSFVQQLMDAEVDARCGAPYGARSPERINRRNWYRERPWETRVGTIPLAVPKVREGSYFPVLAEQHDEWAVARRYLPLHTLAVTTPVAFSPRPALPTQRKEVPETL